MHRTYTTVLLRRGVLYTLLLDGRTFMAVTSLPSASSTPMEALPEVPAVPCTTAGMANEGVDVFTTAGMANEGVDVFTTGVDAVDLFTTGSALSAKHRAHRTRPPHGEVKYTQSI